ncbi:hypothetical protein ACFU9F_35025 [Streptomyces zhihengii]|uniref:hypothetical protein n=1 Tax=Streptomyces zhihengii TaxID=1818004 RepID=UPI00368A9DDC
MAEPQPDRATQRPMCGHGLRTATQAGGTRLSRAAEPWQVDVDDATDHVHQGCGQQGRDDVVEGRLQKATALTALGSVRRITAEARAGSLRR